MSIGGRHSWWLLVSVLFSISLASCVQGRRPGNKLIEADDKKYVACGGAIWSRDDGNLKDVATMSYDVIFKDRHGATQHLTMVHSLAVSDLPDDTPECTIRTPEPEQ